MRRANIQQGSVAGAELMAISARPQWLSHHNEALPAVGDEVNASLSRCAEKYKEKWPNR
jgi:hypothetical protein